MYEIPFEPIVKVGQNVALLHGDNQISYYRISRIQFVHEMPVIITNVTATEKKVDMENYLELNDYEIGQFRIWLVDDITIDMFNPASEQWSIMKKFTSRMPMSKKTPIQDTEFGTWKDLYPTFDIRTRRPNDSYTSAKFVITGFKFKLGEQLTADSAKQAAAIEIEGWK